MYTVAFTLYDTEAVGSLPDWCQSIADSGDDIWLNLYVSKTDDTLLIEDMDRDWLVRHDRPGSVLSGTEYVIL